MLKHILVVAQQAKFRAAVARIFLARGCRVELASSEKAARQLLRQTKFQAAVAAPPSVAPHELNFLRELEDATGALVIFAEGVNASKQFASAFPVALICPPEPLEADQLLRFVDGPALPTERREKSAGIHSFDGCTLDMAGHSFRDASAAEVALTRREFALLGVFVRNAGRVLSRAELRQAIDGGRTDAYDRSIDMLVVRLRRKIEPQAKTARFIITVPGAGYKFVPRVQTLNAEAARAARMPVSSLAHAGQPAERRQLSVLACQILGLAALAAALDPEDLEKAVDGVLAACAEVVSRYGGVMERALGDSVVAYFGRPKAQEHHAESAVRAALELVHAVGAIEAAPIGCFRARVGVATGLMLVAEMDTDRQRRPPLAVGEALNLALRLRQAVPGAGVVIAADTRKLLGRLFDYREIGPVKLEDGNNPVPAFLVTAAAAAVTRFDALPRDDMLPLVGRGAEMERLAQYWSSAQRAAGQLVLVSGEAGIGKSRLVMELQRTLRRGRHVVIRCSGSPYRTEAPMAALLDVVQRSAGFTAGDRPEQKLRKLEALFAILGATAAEATALIASLLGLPCETPAPVQEPPQKRKERVFAVLLASIERTAAARPMLAIVDNAHWLDPTSLEFLTLLVERTNTLRLLLVIAGRPEFVPSWPDYSHVAGLALSRLSRADSGLLVHHAAGDRPVSALIEDEIVSRADGVPLFVEELTRSVLERRMAGARKRASSIPTTLHGLLLARFDRLDSTKEIAQAAAVIGREFSFELLRLITNVDDNALTRGLDRLVSSGLAFCRGALPQASFVFKHALVRDAAYDMLPRERRRALHGAVARAYEERFPEAAITEPELLAYHWREGGEPAKAITYLLAAAERACGARPRLRRCLTSCEPVN
jgi:class 3 adenylate cyclase/DNA-binding response OmpR family regulator